MKLGCPDTKCVVDPCNGQYDKCLYIDERRKEIEQHKLMGVNDMFTIKDKAQAISNNNKLTFGVRVKYSAIAKGIIKPTEYDRKYIVGTYTSLESATHK